jgi:hypothetical protein
MDNDNRDKEHKPSSLPSPEGGKFYGEAREHTSRRHRREETQRREYKLENRSETKYYQAYRPVNHEFWEGLSGEQRDAVMKIQAVAMEKAGFERGTPKYFIDDFDPGAENPMAQAATGPARRPVAAASETALAAPQLVLGGVLLGGGALSLVQGLTGLLAPMGLVVSAALVALAFGGLLAARAGN